MQLSGIARPAGAAGDRSASAHSEPDEHSQASCRAPAILQIQQAIARVQELARLELSQLAAARDIWLTRSPAIRTRPAAKAEAHRGASHSRRRRRSAYPRGDLLRAREGRDGDARRRRDGSEALRQFAGDGRDLIVLDIGMPEMDGLEVCRQIRKTSDVPILFLSARDEEIDRVLGLEIGGDDYVTKPFSPRELVARVNVILRRAPRRAGGTRTRRRRWRHGELALDPAQHRAASTASR